MDTLINIKHQRCCILILLPVSKFEIEMVPRHVLTTWIHRKHKLRPEQNDIEEKLDLKENEVEKLHKILSEMNALLAKNGATRKMIEEENATLRQENETLLYENAELLHQGSA